MALDMKLITSAALLLSEDGENAEYDRGIVELTTDLLGLPMDHKDHVAATLRSVADLTKASRF